VKEVSMYEDDITRLIDSLEEDIDSLASERRRLELAATQALQALDNNDANTARTILLRVTPEGLGPQ
jgi:hypothetical protein